jgi:VWFA-related protein
MARFHRSPRPLILIAIALAAARLAHAQTQPPRFQSGVEVTTVDVTVVDGDGRPVLNLRPGDFVVQVDGVRRRVVGAEWVPLTTAAAATANIPPVPPPPEGYTSNENAAGGRLFVLLVDRLNIRFEGMNGHRPAINTFIDRLQPSDRVAVAASGLGAANTLSFTTDHERVKNAVSKMVGQRGLTDGGAPSHLLRELLIALRSIDAPKTVVLISEGFPLADAPILGDRRPFLVELEQLAAEARAIIYAVKLDTRITDIRQKTQDTNLGPDLTEPPAAADRGAAISQGLPANLGPMPGPANAAAPDAVEAGGGLYSVAAVTGGAMFTVVMDADPAFARIESELSGYYLLGVESDPSHRDGKPHAISVEVARPGVTVRSRRQLVVTRGDAHPRTAEEALLPAFSSPLAIPALPLRVATFSTRSGESPGDKVQLLIHAEIGADYTSPKRVTLGYIIADRNDRIVERKAGNSLLRPMSTDRPSPLQVTASVTLDPGEYTMKLAVVDGDRVGSVEHPIRAALKSAGAVSFSDLIVGGSARARPVLPPAVGSRVRLEYVQGFLEAYGAGAAGLEARFEIAATAGGPAIVSAPVAPVQSGRDRVVLSQVISVGDLPPAHYVLRAVMSPPDGSATTLTRAFEIPSRP